ncbi:MAG: cation-translocating P-type ATPase [Deltaproteobacteria bacterium]|nr:cation-translocating P-type ATPase [Deltaproteobacteria bacterium]
MTALAGLFLAASLATVCGNLNLPVDPSWAAVFICGLPLLYLALSELFHEKRVGSELLVSVAMIACIYIGELFAAGEVAFLMAIGAILEERTVEKARQGVKKLLSLAPRQGRRIAAPGGNAAASMVPVEEIGRGDFLRVLPGETIPVDGVILAGASSVDQSAITGESLPVDKSVGDSVFSGSVNRFGSIDIEATRVGEDSSLQKLIRMVREAEKNKAPLQRIVDRWAAWLVPLALLIAVGVYLGTGDLIRAVTVLVVFCPCALALATPTSIMAAIGQAAKQGVLIKSGGALENMGKADKIAFDKTGTLTRGTLSVSDIISVAPERTAEDLLRLAASAEAFSEHPLGRAVVASAGESGLSPMLAEDFAMLPGKGVRAVVEKESVLLGSGAYLRENGIELDDKAGEMLEKLRGQGKAVILVASGGLFVGALALSDTLRREAGPMVERLRALGADVVLLTGDHARTASWFSKQAGITDVHADLLPEQKVECIRKLQEQGHKVCMIGDGVNDAPALKTADVGVAMGTMGSDIAIEAADIALMGDNISKIPYLKRLSLTTVSTIKFNIAASMLINLAGIVLSVMGLLNPMAGAFIHNAGSLLVVLNAARLYEKKMG